MSKNRFWKGDIKNFDNISEDVALIKIEDEPSISEAERFINMAKETLNTTVLYISGEKSLFTMLCMAIADLIYLDKNTKLFIKKEQISRINASYLSILSSFMNRYILADIIYTGRVINAKEAIKFGMANSLIEYPEVVNRFEKIDNFPFALKLLKKVTAINGGILNESDARFVERMAFALTFCSEDQKEGMSAFLEKRRAMFKGR